MSKESRVEPGASPAGSWKVSASEVDMVRPGGPKPLRVAAEPKPATIDLARTSMIVIDMQSIFSTRTVGWRPSVLM